MVKNLSTVQEMRVQSLSLEDALERKMAIPPVFLPGESRSLNRGVWWATIHGITESDTTNNFTFLFSSLQVGFLRALLSKLSSCISIVVSVSNKPKPRQDLKVILRDR